MSAQDIVLIIGAVSALITSTIAAFASLKNNQKLNEAAARREAIKDELKP